MNEKVRGTVPAEHTQMQFIKDAYAQQTPSITNKVVLSGVVEKLKVILIFFLFLLIFYHMYTLILQSENKFLTGNKLIVFL